MMTVVLFLLLNGRSLHPLAQAPPGLEPSRLRLSQSNRNGNSGRTGIAESTYFPLEATQPPRPRPARPSTSAISLRA